MQFSRHALVATIFLLTLMVGVGTSTMPPALAAVQRHFGISPDVAGILLSVFTLPGLVLTPLLGWLADRIGRKAIIVVSLLVFALGGAAALMVETFEQLVIVRLVQGVGAASLGALNVTLISDYFDGQERIRLIGFNHSVLSIGTALLPVLSSMLAQQGWRLPFALPLSGAAVAVAVLAFVRPVHRSAEASLSTPATAFSIGALSILLATSVITYALLFGPFLNYLQERIRLLDPASPGLYQRIGLMVGLMSAVTTMAALFVGKVGQRYSLPFVLVATCGTYAIAVGLMGTMPSYELLAIPTALFGLAQAFSQPVVQALAAAVAPMHRRGTVLSLNRTAALVGQTTGPVIFGIVYRAGGLEVVFASGAAVALLWAVLLWVWRTVRYQPRQAPTL